MITVYLKAFLIGRNIEKEFVLRHPLNCTFGNLKIAIKRFCIEKNLRQLSYSISIDVLPKKTADEIIDEYDRALEIGDSAYMKSPY